MSPADDSLLAQSTVEFREEERRHRANDLDDQLDLFADEPEERSSQIGPDEPWPDDFY